MRLRGWWRGRLRGDEMEPETAGPMIVHTLEEVEKGDGDYAIVDLVMAQVGMSPEAYEEMRNHVHRWVAYRGPNEEEFRNGAGPAQVRLLRRPRESVH